MIGNQYIATNTFLKNSRIVGEFDGGRGAADTTFTVTIQQDGYYPVRMTFEQDGGGANWEFFSRAVGKNVLVNDANATNAITITQQPQSVTAIDSDSVTFSVSATTDFRNALTSTAGAGTIGSRILYQWQKAAPGSSTFADITNATRTSYQTVAALADSGSKYQAILSIPGLSVTSSVVSLTVTTAAPPPEMKFTNIMFQGGKVTIQWSGTGAFQSAPEVTGPWTDVTGVSSPFTVTATGQRQFYRLRQ